VRALCDYAVKLTTIPSEVWREDADVLRAHGWDDIAIHDAIQVIGYFNYINRIADAVGIDDEPEWAEASAPPQG
jgi:alkylhydroperoxidase family enzyme